MADEAADLALIDTNTLILELARRHPMGFVLLAEGQEGKGRFWRRHFTGPPSTLIGMAARFTRYLLDRDSEDNAEGDEDGTDEGDNE